MKGYFDLREHIANLEKEGLLVRVKREINKDTEIHPLVRWQFRSDMPEDERKGFLFENVVDVKGRKYPDKSVAVGVYASSARIYAMGIGCKVEEINARWAAAIDHRIEPELVSDGPVHEVVHTGKALEKDGGGMDMFPVPISTPGFDNGPYITCANWITKDIETGVRNMGNYRSQVKARTRLGISIGAVGQDIQIHWNKAKAKGRPLEAAISISPAPVIGYAAATKVPRGIDELAVAGGLVGAPIQLVKCKTVDIEVPADSEIVIEGIISTRYLEPEAPFGESHGRMNPRQLNPYLEITAITHRTNLIWSSWISQLTPSESSVIKRDAYESLFTNYLKFERRVPSVTRVVMHEACTNLRKVIIIQMKNPTSAEAWTALHAALTKDTAVGKMIIAIDDDIDPHDLDAVFWAMAYRSNPANDVAIVKHRLKGHGPPFRMVPEPAGSDPHDDDSAMLINACLKEPFPPVSLPKKQYMERAKQIWEELGLPKIKPRIPWFGYSLGQWTKENEEEAELALKGEHYKVGEKLAGQRIEC